jgi:hypothetical protein
MSRDSLLALAAAGPPTDTVEVPGAGPVLVRGLTSAEWDKVEDACLRTGPDGTRSFHTDRGIVVRFAAVNPDGTPRFADADLDALRRLTPAVLGPLYRRAMELSGLLAAATPAA